MKISVIIPCYNVERWIDRCVTSVAAQTIGIDDLEIICVDDASTDDTWAHLQKWEQSFPENVLLIRLEANRRQGAARNIGLQYASADWIAFVEADDWLEPDYFERLYTAAGSNVCDMVTCGVRADSSDTIVYFKEEDRLWREDRYIQLDTEEKRKDAVICKPFGQSPWAKIVRKDWLLEHRIFFLEGLVCEDSYWTAFVHLYVDRVYVVGKKLYHYFSNPCSRSYLQNGPDHIDSITIQLMKWRDYAERGFLETYRKELEYDLLYNAVSFIKTLMLHYDQPPFSFYQLEKQVIGQMIPDYKSNPYADLFHGIDGVLLEALYLPMDQTEFLELAGKARIGLSSPEERTVPEKDLKLPRGLRIIMFYSGTESFNFFTDQLEKEFEKRGHQVFVCDLEDLADVTEHSYKALNRFLTKKVDVVICFDGIGTREEQFIEQWDRHQAVVIDILMDPPFRFHPTLEKHPKKYLLCCCDQEHVEYVKKYFPKEVSNVVFLPHFGTLDETEGQGIPYKKRKYDILFSASYLHPQVQLEKVKGLFLDRPDMWMFYQSMFEELKLDSSMTIEKAVLGTLQQFDLSVSDEMLKMLLNRSVYVDFAIRMYHRGRVVTTLAKAGLELWLLGPGWEDHPSAGLPNVHRLDTQVPYRETFQYMADARINLNVMPGFKAGTHDRIFNTLLQHSLPLTDSSRWLEGYFADGEDIVFYDLDHLERLPGIVRNLLEEPEKAEKMIQKGYEKVSREFTWSNCADLLWAAMDRMRE